MCFSPDSRHIAAACGVNNVHIWDVKTGQLFARLEGSQSYIINIAFTPDSSGLVCGCHNTKIRYWDLTPILRRTVQENAANGGYQCTRTLARHGGPVHGVAVSSDARWIISASWDVWIWDLKTGDPLCKLEGHNARGEWSVSSSMSRTKWLVL